MEVRKKNYYIFATVRQCFFKLFKSFEFIGPLFIREDSGMSTVHGIVSFGVSCGTELPGIYTRIASYVDWIESIVWP